MSKPKDTTPPIPTAPSPIDEANTQLARIMLDLYNIPILGVQRHLPLYVIYGEETLSSSEKMLDFGISNANHRAFFLETDVIPKLPEFPGIELRKTGSDSSSKRSFYEFCVTDAEKAQREGLKQFDKFFRSKQKDTEGYIKRSRDNMSTDLLSIKLSLRKLLEKPSDKMDFPPDFKPLFIGDVTIDIPTKKAHLVGKIISGSFTNLAFVGKAGVLRLTIKGRSKLTSDATTLKGILEPGKSTPAVTTAPETSSEKPAPDPTAAKLSAASSAAVASPEAAEASQTTSTALETSGTTKKEKKKKPKKKLETSIGLAVIATPHPSEALAPITTKAPQVSIPTIVSGDTPTSIPVLVLDSASTALHRAIVAEQTIPEMEPTLPATPAGQGVVESLEAGSNLESQATSEVTALVRSSTLGDLSSSLSSPAPGSGSALSVASSHSTTPSEEAEQLLTLARQKTQFDSEIFRCIERRRAADTFHSTLVDHFPSQLQELIRSLTTSKFVTETQIYGGFVYSQNPKDLDLQVVLTDHFFHNKSEVKVSALLKELLPPELAKISKIERKRDFPPIWKISIGDLLEITTIEQRDHRRNQNWTSTKDAQIINLRSSGDRSPITTEPSHQFGFLETWKAKDPSMRTPPPVLINERAKDCALRVIYSMTPYLLDSKKAEDNSLLTQLSSLLANDLIADGRCIDTLQRKISSFESDHKISGPEQLTFRHNFSQVLERIDPKIFIQSESEVHRKIEEYKSMADSAASYASTPTTPPTTSPAPAKSTVVSGGFDWDGPFIKGFEPPPKPHLPTAPTPSSSAGSLGSAAAPGLPTKSPAPTGGKAAPMTYSPGTAPGKGGRK